MLQVEYNHLEKCIDKIQRATIGIEKTLKKILSRHDRTFMVSIGDKSYNFSYPITLSEKNDWEQKIDEAVKELLKLCLAKMVDNLHHGTKDIDAWDEILVFAMGEPIEVYQIEKVAITDEQRLDDNGEVITSIALNTDSKYVQWQDERLFQNETIQEDK